MAADGMVTPRGCFQWASYFLEDEISDGMAVVVVKSFEEVDVRHDHSERLAASPVTLDFPLHVAEDGAAVPQSGQGVVSGLVLQSLAGLSQAILNDEHANAHASEGESENGGSKYGMGAGYLGKQQQATKRVQQGEELVDHKAVGALGRRSG